MIFTGEYEHTIDAKQRLAVPSEVRSRLEEGGHTNVLYLVHGANGAPWLWPEKTFEQIVSVMQQSLLPAKGMMDYEEFLFSQASRLEIDKAGRIRLPERMLKESSLGQSVVILGVRDHLELRDPTQWAKLRRQKLDMQAEIMLKARRTLEEQQRPTN